MQTVTQRIVHYYLYLQSAQFRNLLQDFFVFPLVLNSVFDETNDKTLVRLLTMNLLFLMNKQKCMQTTLKNSLFSLIYKPEFRLRRDAEAQHAKVFKHHIVFSYP